MNDDDRDDGFFDLWGVARRGVRVLVVAGLGLLAVAVMMAALTWAWPARAQTAPPCGPREAVVAQLSGRYNEAPVGRGLTQAGLLFELYASPAGTWTITLTRPNGIMCLVGSGAGFEAVAPGEAM